MPFTKRLLSLLVVLALANGAMAATDAESVHDAKMSWWREARFGIFVHWGLYAVPAGIYKGRETPWAGEWIMNHSKIPVDDYAKFAAEFNPRAFDASRWVALFKEAGAGYLVFTTKHHDGFAMYGSDADAFNVRDATPFHRDVTKELVDACREAGLRMGFYYSQSQDWSHAGGRAADGHWDSKQDGDFDRYLKAVAVPQVRELLTRYGPDTPAILWWDTNLEMTPARAGLFKDLLAARPDMITNNRLIGVTNGDVLTPEQFIPDAGFPGRDWETCMTMNDTWGYKTSDRNYKSAETLIQTLIEAVSKGGNFLLNVGPDAQGNIPEPQVERLKAIGRWMQTNGESIRGAGASPFRGRPFTWGWCTQRPGRLYLHVTNWPEGGEIALPIRNDRIAATLLSDPTQKLRAIRSGNIWTIELPAGARDPAATVITVDYQGDLDVAQAALPTNNGADGSIELPADQAEVIGLRARLVDGGNGRQSVGWWRIKSDYALWQAQIARAGAYEVTLTYSAQEAGGQIAVEIAGKKLIADVSPSGGWENYRSLAIGTVDLTISSETTIKAIPERIPEGKPLMNLQAVTLRPVNK